MGVVMRMSEFFMDPPMSSTYEFSLTSVICLVKYESRIILPYISRK